MARDSEPVNPVCDPPGLDTHARHFFSSCAAWSSRLSSPRYTLGPTDPTYRTHSLASSLSGAGDRNFRPATSMGDRRRLAEWQRETFPKVRLRNPEWISVEQNFRGGRGGGGGESRITLRWRASERVNALYRFWHTRQVACAFAAIIRRLGASAWRGAA